MVFSLNLIQNSKLRAELADYFVNSTGIQEQHLIVRSLRFWATNLIVASDVLSDNRVKIDAMIDLVDAEIAKNH